MTAKTRNLLLAFAALGLGASTWSSYVHYSLLTQPGYTSICDVNATVSCTQAYLSQYGSLWGVPVALAGLFYFTFVLLLVAFSGGRTLQARENVPGYVFAVSIIGLAFVLYLAWASFFKLNAVCLLCATTYVAVIAIFIISGGATKFPMTALPGRATKDVGALLKSPIALVLALIFSIGAVSLVNVFPREAHAAGAAASAVAVPQYPPLTDQQKFDFIRWLEVQPKENVPVDAAGARFVVVKFNDYQCPACRDTYFALKAIVEKYKGSADVKFVTKHFPLEPECNGNAPGGNHVLACEAAAAMVMAESKGTADKLEEWIFTNQRTLTGDSLRQAIKDVGGIADFDAQYAQALLAVRNDAGMGGLLKVKSTPTLFLNGRRVESGLPPTYVEVAMEHDLKK